MIDVSGLFKRRPDTEINLQYFTTVYTRWLILVYLNPSDSNRNRANRNLEMNSSSNKNSNKVNHLPNRPHIASCGHQLNELLLQS